MISFGGSDVWEARNTTVDIEHTAHRFHPPVKLPGGFLKFNVNAFMIFNQTPYVAKIEFFSRVKEPRALGKVKHELEDVLRIALIGVLTSCDDYDEISDFIDERQMELKDMGFLKLANGVPSGDTIRGVVEAVNPDQMRASLRYCRDQIISGLNGCHVIIDGKKLRGEAPKSRGCAGLYILNAMVSEYEICIAEKRVDDKTNELTILPSVIASLCIVGALVSVDAMGTHRNIAQQIFYYRAATI